MILLNGERTEIEPGRTLAGLLDELGVTDQVRGVAVAVDGEVVPRSRWESLTLAADARVEVLTAMQGG